MKVLGFTEVISQIKNKEVWEGEFFYIEKINDRIFINKNENKLLTGFGINFENSDKFVLRRDKFNTKNAVEKLFLFSIIESCITGNKYKYNSVQTFRKRKSHECWIDCDGLLFEEVLGDWYIIEEEN